ncbi:MAG: putative 28.5 kDa protein [Yunnan virgavirus 3]|nr:MAG: putative 28.5 kDa protein [Yunnan virgavirus 3]
MALIKSEGVKVSDFVNLSKSEKWLPRSLTSVKYVRVSTVDKIIAKENDQLSEVDLLKGVKLIPGGYVKMVGLVVSGEWNLPDNCKGGVSVCIVDRRMTKHSEATLGSYSAAAAKRNFKFKLIPNYSVTTEDAEKSPWQVLVNIRGVSMESGFCPLTLEFLSVCVVHKVHVSIGLKAKITAVTDGAALELTESVVDEFSASAPMAMRYAKFKSRRPKSFENSRNRVNKGKPKKSLDSFSISSGKFVSDDVESEDSDLDNIEYNKEF